MQRHSTAETVRLLNEYVTENLGVPYVYQGRGKDGLDCMGVVVGAFAACGVILPDAIPEIQAEECSRFVVERGLEAYAGLFRRVATRQPEPLDVVLFTNAEKQANHVAVVCGGGFAVHAAVEAGVVCVKVRQLMRGHGVRVYRYGG